MVVEEAAALRLSETLRIGLEQSMDPTSSLPG